MLSHHHRGYKNWQFLDNKTLPTSLQNDQHLVVSGRDWWRQNWVNSHFRRPSLNCKGIYFDFCPCPLIFGLDASLSSPVSFSCDHTRCGPDAVDKEFLFSPWQLGKVSTIWEPQPTGKMTCWGWTTTDRDHIYTFQTCVFTDVEQPPSHFRILPLVLYVSFHNEINGSVAC